MRISNYVEAEYNNLPPNFELESKPHNYRKTIIKSMSLMTRKDQMLIFNNKIKQINSDYDFEKN